MLKNQVIIVGNKIKKYSPPFRRFFVVFVVVFYSPPPGEFAQQEGGKKTPPNRVVFQIFFYHRLVNSRYSQTFASRCASAVQNIASAFGSHFFTKAMCFYTTCFRWLISSFCCHIKILLLTPI